MTASLVAVSHLAVSSTTSAIHHNKCNHIYLFIVGQDEKLDEVLHGSNKRIKKICGRGKRKVPGTSLPGRARLSDLSYWEETEDESVFEGFTMGEVEQDEMYFHHWEEESVGDTGGPTDSNGRLLFPDISDEEEFLGFTVEEV